MQCVEADYHKCGEGYCSKCANRECYVAEADEDVDCHCEQCEEHCPAGCTGHVACDGWTHLLTLLDTDVGVGNIEVLTGGLLLEGALEALVECILNFLINLLAVGIGNFIVG